MKLFLDSANLSHIREIASWGVLDGVTTNPTLVAKEGRDFKETILEICGIVDGPVSAEVVSIEAPAMIREAHEYAAWHKNVYVKLPMTTEGLKALSKVSKEGIKTNVTLIFQPNQALLAAKAGASIVSPFIGRLDDISQVGMEIIRTVTTIYRTHGYKTEVLVASVRDPNHVVEAAVAGAHIATVPYDVFKKLPNHPLTDLGLKRFLDDWNSAKKK
ncbi:MAG TPA: fructose-6-phosphate aldolase [Candidatus Thermoplasmatota archaeon]|nr:fructose-6-phosphate aldolase [Candidatus Thermoplasmatota archaeon]